MEYASRRVGVTRLGLRAVANEVLRGLRSDSEGTGEKGQPKDRRPSPVISASRPRVTWATLFARFHRSTLCDRFAFAAGPGAVRFRRNSLRSANVERSIADGLFVTDLKLKNTSVVYFPREHRTMSGLLSENYFSGPASHAPLELAARAD
ncbi:hypothetical protein EVAR_47819_1 [Eumeta japonica]|uniref:Uncharacterized protein n=1 Tax=Eumeta variegata TaxID=151549 RepID=A0A4C1Z131_EUMVA|nr:hypothetical protein EVAR_47819_1 [Eumeta japonica]